MNTRVERLFHEVADLPADARGQYFAEHSVDEETRREVEGLIEFDAGATAFLERGIGIAANDALPQLDSQERRCGPYRLLKIVGRGGMGAVYLAERVDGEVTQRVAIKLLPAGAGDTQRERFLQERQILASLVHPNIARMFDAGHTDTGQPFLAMEYVEGQPIDAFAAELGDRQKIGLFLKVCAATGYLHRNLVVHRDLKPSNILVTADGEPKLLDFGIAKVLDVTSDATVTNMRMLTPNYASPEQVSGGFVSTATDIYSLGAVLYKLLTGKPVHEFEENSPDKISSVVTTREVTRPSRWVPELKGDLEAILMKALRKDPQERYLTAEQFADDLQSYLDSRPVRARSGNRWYRVRKFARRYWIPLLAGGLVIGSLSAGLYIAEHERALAQRRFQDVRQLSNKLFDIDAQVRQLPGSTQARQLIVDTALEYLQRLRKDVAGDPVLALDVAGAYGSVAEVEGVSPGPSLGQMDRAARDLKIAEDMAQAVLASQPSNRAALLRAALIASEQRLLARSNFRSDEEAAWARKTVERLDRYHIRPGDQSQAPQVLLTYANAEVSLSSADPDEALRIGRRGIELARLFHLPLQQANFLIATAGVLRKRGDIEEALKDAHQAVVLRDPGSSKPTLGRAMNFVYASRLEGSILGEDNAISLGRYGEAVQVLERAFNIADVFVHQDSNDEASRGYLMDTGLPLANILLHTDSRRALSIFDHVLRHTAEITNKEMRIFEVFLLSGSSYALRSLGRSGQAQQRLNRALTHLRQFQLYPVDKIDPKTSSGEAAARVLRALADHEGATGNVPRGIEIHQELLDRFAASGLKPESILSDAVEMSNTWASLATLYRRTGRTGLASAMEARRLELWRQWNRKLPNNEFVQRHLIASPMK
jgi:serine/threonine protein kinase